MIYTSDKKKTIVLASHAGFCYGVKRAVETTKKLKLENKNINISVLGELIHNSHVIKKLEDLGIKTLYEIPDCGDGICIIRSHGESMEVFDELTNKGFKIVDLTCLDVKKVQNKAIELSKDGYFVIILGKIDHPEVKAISKDALKFANNKENILVAQNIDTLKENIDKIIHSKKVGLVLQTTQTKEFLFDVIDYLSDKVKVLRIQNTICPSTALRQQEAKELAKNSDLMVVVGSKKSANTTHLATLLKNITNTIHIEDTKELDNFKNIIKTSNTIGVTAGASTPDELINDVVNKLKLY